VSHYLVQPATAPLAGRFAAPGDKSIGHRAVMLGALCSGAVTISGLGSGADNRGTTRALMQLGVRCRATDDGLLAVDGVGLRGLQAPVDVIDCGNSGTAIRLLCGLLAAQPFDTVLTGDESLRSRPMGRVVEPLARMGARIERDRAPLTVRASAGLRGIDYRLPMASAQVKSALLLAALYADGPTRLTEPGPSRDHSERMLRYLGAPVRSEAGGVTVLDPTGWSRRLEPRPLEVPGDPSSAAFALVAALLVGGAPLQIDHVVVNPTRTGFLDALSAMGAGIAATDAHDRCGEPVANLVVDTAGPTPLTAADVTGDLLVRCIDEVPVLAVAAAVAEGTTWFRDAEELRVKESDRIATTAAMLRAFGVEVVQERDSFAVVGRGGERLKAAQIDSAGDHRIAMAATVAALAADAETRIDDVDNVATSFPGFVEVMRGLGAQIEHRAS
jgi:3-phosphoshikimate 1-carboxyvinyltransferase